MALMKALTLCANCTVVFFVTLNRIIISLDIHLSACLCFITGHGQLSGSMFLSNQIHHLIPEKVFVLSIMLLDHGEGCCSVIVCLIINFGFVHSFNITLTMRYGGDSLSGAISELIVNLYKEKFVSAL